LPFHAPSRPVGQHVPCLLREAVAALLPKELEQRMTGMFDGAYVDCTFGRGGHSREILSRLTENGRLFAFDVDPSAVAVGHEIEQADARFRIIHSPFGRIADELVHVPLNGVLLDLGVSSPQLDERHRGFSVTEDAPLDLRMNPEHALSAAEWLHQTTVEELAWVIHAYGEDDDRILSERIAEAIISRRPQLGPCITTRRLADIIRQTKRGMDDRGTHPAKLTFQAIRVFLNQEMEQLDAALHGAFRRLEFGGRCIIISFKRKEASMIRRFVREHEEPEPYMRGNVGEARLCELYPLLATDKDFVVRVMAEPIKPSLQELERNPRARSSAVHVLQKDRRHWPHLRGGAAEVRGLGLRLRRPADRPTFAGADGKVAAATPGAHGPVDCGIFEGVDMPSLPDGCLTDPLASHTSASAASASMPARGSTDSSDSGTRSPSAADVHAAASLLTKGLTVHRVVDDFESRIAGGEGYLSLKAGESVYVYYEGKEGDEVGWHYGCNAAKKFGWFPSGVTQACPAHAG